MPITDPGELYPYFQTKISTATVTTAATKLCTNNPHRVGLIIANTASGFLWVLPSSSVAQVNGISLQAMNQNGNNLQLAFSQWGALVCLDWWGTSTSPSGQTCEVIEVVYYPPSPQQGTGGD